MSCGRTMKSRVMTIRTLTALLVVATLGLTAAPAAAQASPGRTAVPGQGATVPAPATQAPDGQPISAGQIQRWFEAYTVLQAQEALGLSEAQYGRFVTRLKSLQEIRRRHQQARNQILADLRKLTNPQPTPPDETQVADRMKALREED